MWFSVSIASYTFQIVDLTILYFLNISETVEFSSESSSNANEAQFGTVNKDTTRNTMNFMRSWRMQRQALRPWTGRNGLDKKGTKMREFFSENDRNET